LSHLLEWIDRRTETSDGSVDKMKKKVDINELVDFMNTDPRLKGKIHIKDGIICITGDEPPTDEQMSEVKKVLNK
jgi:hypothetical protein